MDAAQLVTQAEAARRTGIDPAALSRMIRAGRVRTVETADGLPLVPVDEVHRLRAQRPDRGRPRKETAPAAPQRA